MRSWGIYNESIFLFVEEETPKTVQMLLLDKEKPAKLITIELKHIESEPAELVGGSDNISRHMVSYTQGYLLYATKSKIYYMNVQGIIDEEDEIK